MERRVNFHQNTTPTSEPVVIPNLPVVHVDLEAEAAMRENVSFSAPALQTDRLLERLGPRRIAEIRGRLATGAYNSPEVMRQLAIRLFESGDLSR